MRDPFYEMVYHRKNYTLADAFRPQPGWGRRRFIISVSNLGEHTEEDLLKAASDSYETLPGYRLTSVSLFPADGPERVIWRTAAFAPIEQLATQHPPAPAPEVTR